MSPCDIVGDRIRLPARPLQQLQLGADGLLAYCLMHPLRVRQ